MKPSDGVTVIAEEEQQVPAQSNGEPAKPLKRRQKKPWPPNEIARLRELIKTRSVDEVANILGRSRASVATKLKILGIRKGRNTKSWTPEENTLLAELFKTMSASQVAKALGRTLPSVQQQLSVLGIRKGRKRFSKEELQIIARRFPNEDTRIIAESLGRTYQAVKIKASELGLRKTPEYLASLGRHISPELDQQPTTFLRRRLSPSGRRKSPGAPRFWEILLLLRDGASPKEISTTLKCTVSYVNDEAGNRRLRTQACWHDFGEPVTAARLTRFFDATGLDNKTLADLCRITPALYSQLRTHPKRSSWRPHPAIARPVFDLGFEMLRELASRRDYGLRNAVKSFFPDLGEPYRMLLKVFARTQEFLRVEPDANIARWQDWVTDPAWFGRPRNARGKRLPADLSFVRFLRLAPALSPFVERNLTPLRTEKRLSRLAMEALAWLLATPRESRQTTVDEKALVQRFKSAIRWVSDSKEVFSAIPPIKMQGLILTSSLFAGKETTGKKPRKKRGRKTLPTDEKNPFEIAKLVEAKIPPGPRTKAKVTAAREAVVAETRYTPGTVAEYHRRYFPWKGQSSPGEPQ